MKMPAGRCWHWQVFLSFALLGYPALAVAEQTAPEPDPQGPPTPSAAPQDASTGSPQEGSLQILQRAIEQTSQETNVQAEVYQQVEMFGKRLQARGRFLKGDKPFELLWQLQFDHERQAGSFLAVCDGQALVVREEIQGQTRVTSLDVQQLFSSLFEQRPESLRPLVIDLLGLGGIDQLLRGLHDTMDPGQWVRLPRLEDRYQEETGRQVYVVRGQWKPDLLQAYLSSIASQPGGTSPAESLAGPPSDQQTMPPGMSPGANSSNQTGPSAFGKLPPYVPSHVFVYLDRDRGFPYRLEFRHQQGRREEEQTIILMEFRDPKFDQPIDDAEFYFSIPDDAQEMTARTLDFLMTVDEATLEQLVRGGPGPMSMPGMPPTP